jgi:MtfA peptidase
VRARRVEADDAGVVHSWQEDLTGETVQGGPLMLSWSDVAAAGSTASESYNVVIHEFVHVMDMQNGEPDGCPPMPRSMQPTWLQVLQAEYEALCEQTAQWERFGTLVAVAAEAYFVRRADFAAAHPALLAQFDQFFVRYP